MPNTRQAEPSKASLSRTAFALPIIAIHFTALAALWPGFYSGVNLAVCVVGIFVFGQGINLGYHRLLAHRSLEVPKWLEYFYVTLALCCMEESPGKWVATHRRHHTFSDKDDDPHSTGHGFFWAHMGWLLFRREGVDGLKADPRWAADILKDRWYVKLERHWWLPSAFFLIQIVLFFSFGLIVALATGAEWGAAAQSACGLTVWGVVLRTVIVWHITWSVNSLTHFFGYRNYETGEESRNNWLVAILASGEGWHNNHHHDPASASVQHRWWELDLTYYHIRALEALGLAKKVIRPRSTRRGEARGASTSR